MTFDEWVESEGWLPNFFGEYSQCVTFDDGILTLSRTKKELKREYKKYCTKTIIGTEPKEEI